MYINKTIYNAGTALRRDDGACYGYEESRAGCYSPSIDRMIASFELYFSMRFRGSTIAVTGGRDRLR